MANYQNVAPSASIYGGKSSLFAFLAAGTGLMVGLDIGVISGTLDLLEKYFNATIFELELIVSGMMVGAAIGALMAGRTSMKFGRKRVLIVSALIYVIGCLFCASAWSVGSLVIARVILGIAVGAAAFTGPLYISEIAEPERRGRLIALAEIFITTGVLLAFLSNTLLQPFGSWRLMLGIVSVPGLVFLAFAWVLPETPRWLALQGREAEALKTLILLRSHLAVARRELIEINQSIITRASGFGLFRQNANFRRAVYLGIALQFAQQLTGLNIVMYYSPKILDIIGFDETARLWGTTAVGLVNVLAASIAMWLVERAGRRPLLLFGFAGMCMTLIGLGLLLAFGITTPMAKTAALISVLGFVMFFALSAGPVVWVLCSEIQPLQGRDFGVAASTFTNWAANTAVGATFLSLLVWLGASQTFIVYGVLNAAFILFTLKFVPETKGATLEHIERRLFDGVPLRDLGGRDDPVRESVNQVGPTSEAR